MLTLYITTLVIDAIHTRHEKVTAMIITRKAPALQKAIHEKLVRGITILPAKGAYTGEDKSMMYLVITRYELYDLEQIINEVDPNRSEEHTSELQSRGHLVCRLLLE